MDTKKHDEHLAMSLGSIPLGANEDSLVTEHGMRKGSAQEIHLLRYTGMNIGPDETVYLRDPIGLFGPEWVPLVIVRKGKVAMISLQRVVDDEQTKERIWNDASMLYMHELGQISYKTDTQVVWDLSHNRKVVIEKRDIWLGTAGRSVSLILSCTDPDNLPQSV